MSEFVASRELLDIGTLYNRFYDMVRDIMGKETEIGKQITILRRYSGFGVEAQIRNLEACRKKLAECREEIDMEFAALAAISEYIRNAENKATGLLGGKSEDVVLNDYSKEKVTVPGSSESTEREESGIFSAIMDFIAPYLKNFGDMLGGFKDLFDFFEKCTGISGQVFEGFSNFLGAAGGVFCIFSGIGDMIARYTDGKITPSDFVGTIDDVFTMIQGGLSIGECITGADIFVNATTAVEDTIKVGGHFVGEVTQYLPVIGVGITTVLSGVESYEKYMEDGVLTGEEIGEIGIDSSVDGLIAVGEAAVCLACPPAAIGVAVLEIADLIVGHNTGTSFKDAAKEAVKDFGRWGSEKYAQASEWISETASNVGEWVGETASNVGEWFGNGWSCLCGVFS